MGGGSGTIRRPPPNFLSDGSFFRDRFPQTESVTMQWYEWGSARYQDFSQLKWAAEAPAFELTFGLVVDSLDLFASILSLASKNIFASLAHQ